MAGNYQLYVGVDISAETFTAIWGTSSHFTRKAQQFKQIPSDYQEFQKQLSKTGVTPERTLIAMEASSNYWVSLALMMHQAGYVVSILNPRQVAYFARSLPQRSKTDKLDAQLILQFAVEREPKAWTPPDPIYHELRQRLVVRDQLLAMRTQASNQYLSLQQWPFQVASPQESLETILQQLDTELKKLDKEIMHILKHGEWAQSAKRLLSIPSVGLVTTAWLLVSTMNFLLPIQQINYVPMLAWYQGNINLEQAFVNGLQLDIAEIVGYEQLFIWLHSVRHVGIQA